MGLRCNLGSVSSLYEEGPNLPTMISAGISKYLELSNLKNKIYLTAEPSTKISPTKFKLGADILEFVPLFNWIFNDKT